MIKTTKNNTNMTQQSKDILKALKEALEELETTRLQPVTTWRSASDVPQDGRYIVRTRGGETFFFEPIGGTWPDWVEKWMPIPE